MNIDQELLTGFAAQLEGRAGTIDQMERGLEEMKRALGQQALDLLVAKLPPEDGKPKPCPHCRKPASVHEKGVARSFEALTGSHTLVRNYHYCRRCKKGFYPRDAELGLPAEGSVTPQLEKRLLDFAVNDPYGHCTERWEVHYPDRPFSDNMFRLTSDRVGRRLEVSQESVLQKELSAPTTGRRDLLYVLNDGSMLPKTGGVWKEAKVGVLLDGDDYVPGGRGKRGHVNQARYVAVWGKQDEFKEMMRHALDAQRWRRYREVVWLGDGAPSNWVLAEALCPEAVQILDPGHAVENGVDCGKALLGEKSPLLPAWQSRIEQLLYEGDVAQLVDELMECLPETTTDAHLEALNDIVRYYRNNQERMNYPLYRSKGWMIGSGIVESAHRHVLQKRMKLAGQHWSETGGRRMVRLRAAYRTAGPKRFHDAINKAALRTSLIAQREAQRTRHRLSA